MTRPAIQAAILFTAWLLVVGGCDRPTESNTADAVADQTAPELTLKQSLDKVHGLATKIGQGFTDGEHEKAHGPMHEIVHLLEELPRKVDSSDLAVDVKKSLNDSIKTIMDSFDKVDAKLHGDENGVEFSDVKEKVDAALDNIHKIYESL